jgi:hypothetical protein
VHVCAAATRFSDQPLRLVCACVRRLSDSELLFARLHSVCRWCQLPYSMAQHLVECILRCTPSPHSQVRRIAVLKLKAQIKAFGYHDGAGGWVYVHQRGDVYEGVAEGCHRLVAMQELYAEEPEPEKEKYKHMRARVLKDVSPQWLGIFCQREFLRSRWHDIMCMCALPLILLASKVC